MRLHVTSTSGCLLVLALVTACQGCRDEKPYTPFGVASALPPPPTASAAATEAPSAAPPAKIAAKKALLAPADAQRWTVAGRDIESPPGRRFEQAIDADFDADGQPDIAAWTIAAADAPSNPPPGELWFYPATGEPRRSVGWPAFLPTGPDCRHAAAVTIPHGTTLLTLDVMARCETRRLSRSPTRALAVLELAAREPLRFGLRAADAAPGEFLELSLLPSDEDGDGRTDYRLTAGLGVATEARTSAALVWLDRAAGVSRDGREPRASLTQLLSNELGRARQKKTANAALRRVDGTRRWLGSVCAEGATARLFDWEGAPLRCGSLASVVDRLAAVEIAAALTEADLAAALGVLSRDGWYFGAMTQKQRDTLSADLQKRLTRVPATRIALGVRPRATRAPSYAPITFDSANSLLIQGESALFRVTAGGARAEPIPADAGILPWPLELTAEGGGRLLGVSYSCDSSEVGLLLLGGSSVPVSSQLLAPRPGVCAGQTFEERFTPAAVRAQPLEVLVGGALIVSTSTSPAPAAIPPGSARSNDGKLLAIASPLGLFIREQGAGELWSIDGWSTPRAQHCVVANGKDRAACVRGGQVELYLATRGATAQP